MNRNVMKRQMFAGGGAAFPDLSGDGEITQRDILMGRGVQFMQEGGIASMGMDPMAGAPMAAGPEQIDPQVLEGAMMTASENFGALDDAQNYEEVIDSIRGDALPIEQRYQELAQFVGPQDAQQTPESVLAMVQPVIQMAAVDGGIGGLASNEMNAEVSGPMAEGIMSTIAMEGGEEPPVNFSQGGDARRNTQDVRYYADGGPIQYFAPENPRVVQPNALNRDDLYAQAQARYQGAAGFQDQQTQFDERKNLTQSQMLFDIAGAGLALAGGDGSKSFAQNLADAAQNTQLFDKLSARTASLADYKDSQAKERRDINLAALKSSEDEFRAISAAEVASKNEMKKLNRTNAFRLLVLNKEQTFNKGQNETNRDHALKLADKRGEYQLQLQNLQNDNSTEGIKLRGDLQKELANINNQANSALAGDKFDQQMKIRNLNSADQFGQIALNHSNALDRLGKTEANELNRIQLNQDFTTKRDDHLAGIAAAAVENNQVYQAYQNSLNRLKTWEVTKFNAELSKELQKAGFDEAAIDREIKSAQQTFANNVTEDQLNLQNYIAATDTQYKLQKLAIDKAAASAIKLDNKGDILSYISNEARIEAYARNELGENTSLYETVLTDFYRDKVGSWDGESYVMTPAPKLTDKLLKAIEQRQNNGLSTPTFSGDVGTDGKVVKEEIVFDVKNPPDFNGDPTAWRKALFSGPNKSLQLDSALWASVPTNIASEDVDYTQPVGLSAIPKKVQSFFENTAFELGFTDSISQGTIKFSEGQKDLTVLANRVLLGITNMSSDRVLKSVVDEIQKEVENLKPGIFQYSSDTGATLNAIASQLSTNIQNIAKALPEYEGTVGDRNKASINKNRAAMDESISLLAEVLKVRDNFYNSYEDQTKTKIQLNSTEKNKAYLNKLLEKK